MNRHYCTLCGRKVLVLINRIRNKGTYHHRKRKHIKDHDLCRQCFRTVMQRLRNTA